MYLRTGKRLANKATTISIQFKVPPLKLFQSVQCAGDLCDLTHAQPNLLTFHIAPDAGISLGFSAKRPAMQVVVENAEMDFRYADKWDGELPEAYERLLLDALRGDATLFARADEVELSWSYLEPLLQALESPGAHAPSPYALGSEGPEVARSLPSRNHHRWSKLSL